MPLIWNLKQFLKKTHDVSDATAIRRIIRDRTGYTFPLRTVQILLTDSPKQLPIKTLQVVSDAFGCQLTHFCQIKPSPRTIVTKLNIETRLQLCAVDTNETLDSFIARVQKSAIEEAFSISNNVTHVARRLGYDRSALIRLRNRMKTSTHITPTRQTKKPRQSSNTQIPLPRALFTIEPKESLHTFVRRIKNAVIDHALTLEGGNQSKAALRLSYKRTSLITWLRRNRLNKKNPKPKDSFS
jgi:DNA-binding NtrC family response regulator